MRAQEYRRGEVTAFLALIFVLLVAFTGSLMESASIQTAKSYRRADMNRAMESIFAEYQRELLEEYDIFALDGSYESGNYSEAKVTDRLSFYGGSGIDQKIERMEILTDQNGKAFLEQVARCVESKYGLEILNNLQIDATEWTDSEQELDLFREQSAATDVQLSGILGEQGLELPTEDNPLPNIQRLAASPLTAIAIPEGQAVSEKAIAIDTMVSHRELREGFGSFEDVAETKMPSKLSFGEYVLDHFDSAAKSREGMHAGAMDYEVEYILFGEDSDRENLEQALKKLLAIRFVPNFAYLQGSAPKQAEAQALALTLCTVIAFPAAAEALAQMLLFAWAFGESIMDLKALMKGGGVPLLKTDASWQLSLSGLMKLGQDGQQEAVISEEGMTYEEYLRVLLFLNHKEEMPLRALDMIELCLQKEKGLAWFRADSCISKLEIESKVKLRRGITYEFRTYYGYQ